MKIPKYHWKEIEIAKLKPNPMNVKIHTQAQIDIIKKLILSEGFIKPVAIDKTFTIWAGHGAVIAATQLGMKKVPYVDWSNKSIEERKLLMIADNMANESDWNVQNVRAITEEIAPKIVEDYNLNLSRFEPDRPRIEDEAPGVSPTQQEIKEVTIPNEAPQVANSGDIFQLGDHFIMCGDSQDPKHVAKLLNGNQPHTVCTDPPYSSGGRQEAHKKQGSIGTKRQVESGKEVTPRIKMDDLSTRGYTSLIKSALYGIEADIAYLFTDWRMWDWTREACEASAFPVRNMLVWDKMTPGMGIQWRGQHELIAFCKRTPLGGPFHKGNVLPFKRSGNEHHPTEKPVALLAELLSNTNGNIVYDPFAGSGSTMMACEQLKMKCYSMELDPKFCDIMIKRFEDFTGKKAVKLE